MIIIIIISSTFVIALQGTSLNVIFSQALYNYSMQGCVNDLFNIK